MAVVQRLRKPKLEDVSRPIQKVTPTNRKDKTGMANRFFACPQGSLLPKWVVIWLVVSTVLCVMDVFYTMMRPMTNRGGGVLATLYEPWNIYADVDYRYADKADLVTMATGRVMTIEIVMNIAAIFMNNRQSRHTVLTVFTSSAFVFWKTVWYMVLYIRQPEGTPEFINPEASLLRQIIVFWIADGVWVIAPLLVMIALWDRLAKNDYSECHAPEDCDEEEITKKSLSSAESSS